MDINNKKTTLGDDAAIYQRSEERNESKSTREKWSELNFKGKCQFFVDYYLIKLIIITAFVTFVGFALYTTLKPRPEPMVNIVMLDSLLDIDATQDYFEAAVSDIGWNSKKETIAVHDGFSSQIPTDVSNISTYIFAGTLDVLIAPEASLDHYAHQSAAEHEKSVLLNLDGLPQDILDALSEEDKFYYTDEETGTVHFYGVRLDKTDFYKTLNVHDYDRTYIYTFVSTGKLTDNGVKLLRYLLGLPQPQ